MSVFECLRKWHEDNFNYSRVRLERFILVRSRESVARCSARDPHFANFVSLIEGTMTITPILFALIIFLFGFESTGPAKTRRPNQREAP